MTYDQRKNVSYNLLNCSQHFMSSYCVINCSKNFELDRVPGDLIPYNYENDCVTSIGQSTKKICPFATLVTEN